MSLRDDYNEARKEYHAAGAAAKGTPKGSAERKRYAEARKAYRDAGNRLRAEKVAA